MEDDKNKKMNKEKKEVRYNKKIKTEEKNIGITEKSIDIDSKEERPGIGYEIFGQTTEN